MMTTSLEQNAQRLSYALHEKHFQENWLSEEAEKILVKLNG